MSCTVDVDRAGMSWLPYGTAGGRAVDHRTKNRPTIWIGVSHAPLVADDWTERAEWRKVLASGTDWLMLGGIFLGGALPWLEAIVVIPVGILANLPAVLVVLVAVTGNLLTVWLTAFYGQRIRDWWIQRRRARVEEIDEPEDPQRRHRRQERINRIMVRWGMPGLAVLGPLGLGTQLSALAAVAAGVGARSAFLWVGAGTIAWSVVAAALTMTGASFMGIGADAGAVALPWPTRAI